MDRQFAKMGLLRRLPDYFPNGSLAGTFNDFDTIIGFATNHKIGVSSLVGTQAGTFAEPTALAATTLTKSLASSPAVKVTDKAIYTITDAEFNGSADATLLAETLFTTSGENGHFLQPTSTDAEDGVAVVVIYGKDSTAWIYYLNNAHTESAGGFVDSDIALVAKLTGVADGSLAISNFA